MIASIITAVAIALMSVAIFLLSARVKEVESDTEDITKVKKALQAQQRFIRDIEEDLTKCEEKAVYADGSIETIFKKLENITADIKRLDEMGTKVAKDQSEIRKYYVNYVGSRSLPKYSTGVSWKDKCFDDMDTDEKISVWCERAEMYHNLIGKGDLASDIKYTQEYNKCIEEIQRLQNGEDND